MKAAKQTRELGTWVRKFLGKTEGFESKEEQRFEQKHLKAYIKGREFFFFGKEEVLDSEGNLIGMRPKRHKVKEESFFKPKTSNNGD
jgi:hypothetical protein